jgi:FkbM family methyltransferase
MEAIFTNDNNVRVQLPIHYFSQIIKYRDNHEVIFRRICTFLINSNNIHGNILDSGAWIGDNAIPWAKNIKTTVYAIDPSNENCVYIKKVAEMNSVTNIQILAYALSDKEEDLFTSDDINHCSFLNTTNPIHKVSGVSLDHLESKGLIQDIGFIHLDIEGFEFKALRGASKLIDKCRPIIAFEQHLETDDYKGLSKYLNEKSYKVFMINEVLPGCRPDCRNFIGFPNERNPDLWVSIIHTYLNFQWLLKV